MMAKRIEEYALIGDTHTAALVGRDGAIDWLPLPRFDSAACFAALIGDGTNGSWRIAPRDDVREVRRRYRGDTLVLETTFTTERSEARLIDFMPIRSRHPAVVRIVEGVRGSTELRCELGARFDYGSLRP
jgi:GH15 family glucan-1,4-alpha-glucosidase